MYSTIKQNRKPLDLFVCVLIWIPALIVGAVRSDAFGPHLYICIAVVEVKVSENDEASRV